MIKRKVTNKIIRWTKPRPWMKGWERKIIEKVLLRLRPLNCLEWGAGFSTIYFPNFLTRKSKWLAIEHDGSWAKRIELQLILRRLFSWQKKIGILHILPNNFPWSDLDNDGSYSDLKDYVDFPKKFIPFYFILIDGRARKACLCNAFKLIDKNGVVILHDANRKYYHRPFSLFQNNVLFYDNRKNAGGLWVGSRKLSIKKLLGLNKSKIFIKG